MLRSRVSRLFSRVAKTSPVGRRSVASRAAQARPTLSGGRLWIISVASLSSTRQSALQRSFQFREEIRLTTIPDLRITSTNKVVFIARGEDKRDIAGQKRVGDRIYLYAAEVHVENRRIDLRVRLNRRYGSFDRRGRSYDNRADVFELVAERYGD